MTAPAPLRRRLTRHVVAFTLIIAVVFGGFAAWGATAPIASAAIAGGIISPAGLRMTVQHLEGGIVRDILVDEGDSVAAGEALVVFDATQANATLEFDQTQLMRLSAMKARLDAHQEDRESFSFPAELVLAAESDSEFAAFLATQQTLFTGERTALRNQLDIYSAQLAQLEAEVAGRRQEIVAADDQLGIVGSEIERLGSLVDQGLAQRSDLAQLQRIEAEYRAQRAQAESLIAQAEQRMVQLRLNLAGAPSEFHRQIADQVSALNLQLAQIRERVRASTDIVNRTVVRAPVAGTVVGMRLNTPDAVIGPGQPLLDIVPTDAVLVVNARLSPIDIDTVHVGLAVEMHVLSFLSRHLLPISGEVVKVSADAFTDQATGETYYAVEIAIDESTIAEKDREVLVAGMPVEVYIFTGSRTFLEYLAAPIAASFRRSFRES